MKHLFSAKKISKARDDVRGYDCGSYCAYLCITDCTGYCKYSCFGCTGSCSGGCTSCTGNCSNSCSYYCALHSSLQ